MKGAYFMRGDAFRRAMETAEPELAKAIWDELMSPKPSKKHIRDEESKKVEFRMLQARKKHVKAI